MEHIHLHLHVDGVAELNDTVRIAAERLGLFITQQGEAMSQALDDLTEEVTTTRGVMASAVVLIQGFAQRLIDAGTDPAALAALQADLHDGEAALAAAVDANQPAP